MIVISSRTRPLPAFDTRADLPIAVVVGAGGMSMAIAQRLGQSHRIVLASLQDAELQRGQQRLHDLGVVSTTVVCNIADAGSVQQLATRLAGLGRVQSLAHVAALSPSHGDWQRIVSVNLIGAALIERALLPSMVAGGSAVFISSLSAHRPEPDAKLLSLLDEPLRADLVAQLAAAFGPAPTPGNAYSLSKFAMNRLVQRRASAWGGRGCRINSISPGLIDTEMGVQENTEASKDSKTQLRQQIPLRRDGSMADIADALEFLVSPRASYINGTDLLVDGGLAAALRTRAEAREADSVAAKAAS